MVATITDGETQLALFDAILVLSQQYSVIFVHDADCCVSCSGKLSLFRSILDKYIALIYICHWILDV